MGVILPQNRTVSTMLLLQGVISTHICNLLGFCLMVKKQEDSKYKITAKSKKLLQSNILLTFILYV